MVIESREERDRINLLFYFKEVLVIMQVVDIGF